jgi:ribosomal protein S18 acetylase RimI-like enzyme
VGGKLLSGLIFERSARYFADIWQLFAQRARAGHIEQVGSAIIASSCVAWPVLNAVFLSQPLHNLADLTACLGGCSEYFGTRSLGWMFFPCMQWIAEPLHSAVPAIATEFGLQPFMNITGMEADQLQTPERNLPELEFRSTQDASVRLALAEVNAAAYGLPVELALEPLNVDGLWTEDVVGFVGYWDGRPVTSAVVIVYRDVLYVALVASLPAVSKRGFAEAVMRCGLRTLAERTGLKRTALHATPVAFSLYRRMGYLPVASFPAYISFPRQAASA